MCKFFYKTKKNHESAFTLVELMVALAIFSVVITITLGSVLSVIDAGRKAEALKAVMTNLNFTVEVMSREIKFGKKFYCGTDPNQTAHTLSQDCTGGVNAPASSFTFTTSDGVDTIYRLNGTVIEKSVDHGVTYIGVTSPEITIQDMKFYVFGTTAYPDSAQPRVFMIIRGFAGTKVTTQSNFILQTVMSQRTLDS